MRLPSVLALSAVLAAPLCVGCANGPDLALNYAQTGRENYELSVAEFSDRDFEEAIKYADFVRIRFPFSRYAVEAELLIARSRFEMGEYLTAKDAFKMFSKMHPTHEHVRNGWVAYMSSVCAFMAAPTSFPLMPKDYQRDQSPLREALVELRYFFDHYPNSQLYSLAEDLQERVLQKLLEHELYVARFYLDRDRPEAAIGRLEGAHDRYPGIGFDAEILFLLGITYLRIEEVELARTTFSELQVQHPKHHHGRQAKLYLGYIQRNFGPADPNRPRPDRPKPIPVAPPKPKKEALPGYEREKRLEERRAREQRPETPDIDPVLEPTTLPGQEEEKAEPGPGEVPTGKTKEEPDREATDPPPTTKDGS